MPSSFTKMSLLEIDPKEEQQTMAEVKEINKILFEETIEKGEKTSFCIFP
mgnify:CR=1 FL=1